MDLRANWRFPARSPGFALQRRVGQALPSHVRSTLLRPKFHPRVWLTIEAPLGFRIKFAIEIHEHRTPVRRAEVRMRRQNAF